MTVCALIALSCAAAFAQAPAAPSLADVARQAEAAKATAKKAKKSYTNSDLSVDFTAPAPAPASAVTPSAPVATAGAPPAPAAGAAATNDAKPAEPEVPKESEETWRMRAESLRKQIDDMKARVAQLSLPDPRRDENPVLKRSNDVNLATARSALDGLKTQWARFEASAKEVKIPMAWIEPLPSFQ